MFKVKYIGSDKPAQFTTGGVTYSIDKDGEIDPQPRQEWMAGGSIWGSLYQVVEVADAPAKKAPAAAKKASAPPKKEAAKKASPKKKKS